MKIFLLHLETFTKCVRSGVCCARFGAVAISHSGGFVILSFEQCEQNWSKSSVQEQVWLELVWRKSDGMTK